jgi:hypothetical protein
MRLMRKKQKEAEMSAKLVAYQHVPLGFEMLINLPGSETGRVWNHWWNIQLSDDPEAWDDEVRFLNELQGRLEPLSTEDRLIRAQMAGFCRAHPLFPGSIDLLCEEIGASRFSHPVNLGCEGRGLLTTLGQVNPQAAKEKLNDTLLGYVRSLNKWLAQGSPENLLDSKIFGFLGQPAKTKEGMVKKLLSAIDPSVASISNLKKISREICIETQGESILERPDRPMGCFKCDGCSEGEAGPGCECSYGMLLDAALVCVGASDEGKEVLDEFRRFTQETILAYCLAINSWLRAVPAEPVTSITTMRYITEDIGRQITQRVHASLGEKNDVKDWLVACLLKTVRDNQRWHNRVELIDGFPQATSWFKEHQPA